MQTEGGKGGTSCTPSKDFENAMGTSEVLGD
jgi:hypothetical protein